MKQMSINTRIILAFIFSLVVVVATAYLQVKLHFSTYLALAICIIAACLFFWIINASE